MSIRPDGTIRWIHERGVLTRDKNGRPIESQTKFAIEERVKRLQEIGLRLKLFLALKIPDEAGTELSPGLRYSSPGFKYYGTVF